MESQAGSNRHDVSTFLIILPKIHTGASSPSRHRKSLIEPSRNNPSHPWDVALQVFFGVAHAREGLRTGVGLLLNRVPIWGWLFNLVEKWGVESIKGHSRGLRRRSRWMDSSFSLTASNMNSLGVIPLDLQWSSTRSYNALGMSAQTHSPVDSDFSLIILPFHGLTDSADRKLIKHMGYYRVSAAVSSSSKVDGPVKSPISAIRVTPLDGGDLSVRLIAFIGR